MKLVNLTNPQALLDSLEQCQRQVEANQNKAEKLPEYLSEQLAPQIESFEDAYYKLESARERLGQVRVRMRREERELRQLLRDGYHCARRYAKRQNNPELIHMAFGLHQSGRFPNQIKDLPNPTLLAQRMLEANERHAPAGDNILRMPTPSELRTQREKLIAALDDYHAANNKEQQALETMRSERQKAETLLLSIKAHIRVQNRNQPAVARRQLMRAYGFQYKTQPERIKAEQTDIKPNTTERVSRNNNRFQSTDSSVQGKSQTNDQQSDVTPNPAERVSHNTNRLQATGSPVQDKPKTKGEATIPRRHQQTNHIPSRRNHRNVLNAAGAHRTVATGDPHHSLGLPQRAQGEQENPREAMPQRNPKQINRISHQTKRAYTRRRKTNRSRRLS